MRHGCSISHTYYSYHYTMAKRRVTLDLSEEQEEAIKAFFAHNDWEFKEVGMYFMMYINNCMCSMTLFSSNFT